MMGLLKIIGRCRLLFGNCPACNSDAPKMYDCSICDWNKQYNNRLKKDDRKYWWGRYITRLNDPLTMEQLIYWVNNLPKKVIPTNHWDENKKHTTIRTTYVRLDHVIEYLDKFKNEEIKI